jgi:hypothetical protein
MLRPIDRATRFKNILGVSNEAAEIFRRRVRPIMEYLTAYRAGAE